MRQLPSFVVLAAIAAAGVISFVLWQLLSQPNIHNFIAAGLLISGVAYIVYNLLIDRVPTIATDSNVQRMVLGIMQQQLDNNSAVVVDLGSGRGGFARRLGRGLPAASIIGIELATLPHWQAVLAQRVFNARNVKHIKGSFFDYSCAHADAVVMYQSDKMTRQLGEKLAAELKPGALVITIRFPLHGVWQPVDTVSTRFPYRTDIFIYRR